MWLTNTNRRQPSWTVCKKDVKAPNDPALSQAAQQNAATAEKAVALQSRSLDQADAAQAFSEKFYTENIAPLLAEMVSSSKTAGAREDDLYKFNKDIATKSNERYEKYGIPAEERYYKMVEDYSSEAEQENQARAALGDMRAAQGVQQQNMMRKMGALGIAANSPAAVSAMADMAVSNAAAEAGAMTRARDAARALGMQLKSDAANFGRGGTSATLAFGNAASGNAQGAFGVSQGALGAANGAASVPMAGYSTALQGYGVANGALGTAASAYGNNVNAYTRLQTQAMQSKSDALSGFGQLIGTIGGAAIARRTALPAT